MAARRRGQQGARRTGAVASRPHAPLSEPVRTAQEYLREGRADFAQMILEQVLSTRRDDVAALELLLQSLASQGLWQACEERARELLSLRSRHPLGALAALEASLRTARYDTVGERVPAVLATREPAVQKRAAELLLEYGFLESARELFLAAFRREPGLPGLVLGLSKVVRFTAEHDPLLVRMHRLAGSMHGEDLLEADVHFALGKAYEDRAQLERAAHHFEEGNRLVARHVAYDRDAHGRSVDALIQHLGAERCDALSRDGVHSALPVLIVGMPRSGTTLVERILAAHPQVAAGGELPLLDRLSGELRRRSGSALAYPGCMSEIGGETLATLARDYLDGLRRIDAGADRITDKMPTNFMHLGLLAVALPGARVVHCVRARADVSVSCHFQQFASGNDWSYRAEDLRAFYDDYLRLMAHWRTLPGLLIFDLDYQALVRDPAPVVKDLLEFLELPFDAECLSPQRVMGAVRTASDWQVRAPINDRSVGRGERFRAVVPELLTLLGA